jgi:putative heme transporter
MVAEVKGRDELRLRGRNAAFVLPPLAAALLTAAVATLAWVFLRPLALLTAAGILACGVDPLVRLLERRLPRTVAVLLIYFVLLIALTSALVLASPALIDQGQAFLQAAPDQIARASEWMQRGGGATVSSEQFSRILVAGIERLGGEIVSLPLQILSAATEILVVVVMSIYWLLSAPAMLRFALSLAPPSRRPQMQELAGEVCETMGRYVLGIITDMLVLGVVFYIGLSVIGVRYSILLALLAGLGAVVPIIGPILSAIPALAIAFVSSPLQALIVLIFYVVVHNVESDMFLPALMKNQANIPPLLVVFALIAAASTGSILAVLISIPLAGAARVIVLRLIAPGLRGLWERDPWRMEQEQM